MDRQLEGLTKLSGQDDLSALLPPLHQLSDRHVPEIPDAEVRFDSAAFGPVASKIRERAGIHNRTELNIRMTDLGGEFKVRPEWAEQHLQNYYKVFEAAFPDTKERPSIEVLRAQITSKKAHLRLYSFEIDGEVVGGQHMRILNTGKEIFGVMEHLWVSPAVQRGGLGSAMLAMTEPVLLKSGATFCLAEFNDPGLMTQKEREQDLQSGITPEARLKFWKRQGFRMVDAPYIQPRLQDAEDPVQYLMLGVKILSPEAGINGVMPTKTLLRALRHFYESFSPKHDDDPIMKDLLARLKTTEFVAVRDLIDDKRTFLQLRTDLPVH